MRNAARVGLTFKPRAQASPSWPSGRIHSLQILRFVAASLVIVFGRLVGLGMAIHLGLERPLLSLWRRLTPPVAVIQPA